MNPLLIPVLEWYDEHARDLPWRADDATPWGVMVSEFMLQQTPVARVLPVWRQWVEQWPTPTALAASSVGDAVRAWGKLGYPRRALRLHAAASAIVTNHDGQVPGDYDTLLTLAGVGDYTAAAIASFAFGGSHAVLDTNVRRVLGRAVRGVEFPAASVTRAERDLAESLVPPEAPAAWAVGVMELGALVCTATSPSCGHCPLTAQCAWVQAGRPAYDGPPRRVQKFAGTDRQCRGRILDVFRGSAASVTAEQLSSAWADTTQRDRCLQTLIADGLLVETAGDRYALPG